MKTSDDALLEHGTRAVPARARHSAAKRGIDVAGSALLLVLLALPMAVIALLVVASSGWPVTFTQDRPGLDGHLFRLRKFRTMRDTLGPDGHALPDAERVTRLGRVLRATSLDELPELFNVLRGDMSLVGPRPLLTAYLPLYTPEQARRHEVRPGITGLAQVAGRKALSWGDTFALDVAYVDTWSLALDLRILLRTAWALVARAGGTSREDFSRPDFTGVPPERSSARTATTPSSDAWRPVGEATLRAMTDEQLADWKRHQGAHVVAHGGRSWERVHSGFYQTVDLLEPVGSSSASRPTPRAWGWRAAVPRDDRGRANASIPVRLLEDLAGYGEHVLSGNRRSQLRKSRRSVEVVVAADASPLLEDGYALVRSSAERIGFSPPPPEVYRRTIAAYVGVPGAVVVVGLVDGRPAGFLTAHAGQSVVYVDHVYVRTDALTTNISLGLLFELLMLCQRSDGPRSVAHGLERLGNPGLGRFKESMGFGLADVPARVSLPWGAATLARVARPESYHRLTGHAPSNPEGRAGHLRQPSEGTGTPAHSA